MYDMDSELYLQQQELAVRLTKLETEHRNLDAQVLSLQSTNSNALHIQRLKREKLRLKDEITRVKSTLFPDIIA